MTVAYIGLVASAAPEAIAARQLAVAFLKAELLDHSASSAMLRQNPPVDVQLLSRAN